MTDLTVLNLMTVVGGLMGLFAFVSTVQTAWNTAEIASTLNRVEQLLSAGNVTDADRIE